MSLSRVQVNIDKPVVRGEIQANKTSLRPLAPDEVPSGISQKRVTTCHVIPPAPAVVFIAKSPFVPITVRSTAAFRDEIVEKFNHCHIKHALDEAQVDKLVELLNGLEPGREISLFSLCNLSRWSN